ncbi:hypothetical protein LINGRAHAP2_LOCUS695 [Linum grandiflorum]
MHGDLHWTMNYSSVPFAVSHSQFSLDHITVVDDKFVRDSVKFTDESTSLREAFRGFYPGSDQGGKEPSSSAVVDVEAEVKDAD